MDTVHNHDATPKTSVKIKKNANNPARKVLKLQEQLQEALKTLDGELISKCTNINALTQCCTNLKTIINTLKTSIEKNDGRLI